MNRAATTIFKAGEKIPEDKKESLEKIIIDCLRENEDLMSDITPAEVMINAKKGTFTQAMLNFSSTIRPQKLSNRDKLNPHGQKVVEIF